MTLTVNSNGSSYLPASAFLARCDLRTVADLVSDTGSRATGTVPDPNALATNANLLAALLDASGDVEKAALAGQRYAAADLALLATTTCAGQGILFRLIARLTLLYLAERRPNLELKIPESVKQAYQDLDDLRAGVTIFPFTEAAKAGLMDTTTETPVDVDTRWGASTQSRRGLGVRANRRWPRGGSWAGGGSFGGGGF